MPHFAAPRARSSAAGRRRRLPTREELGVFARGQALSPARPHALLEGVVQVIHDVAQAHLLHGEGLASGPTTQALV